MAAGIRELPWELLPWELLLQELWEPASMLFTHGNAEIIDVCCFQLRILGAIVMQL